MKVTLITATIVIGETTTLLTKSICRQLAWFDSLRWTKADVEAGEVKCLGSVDLGDGLAYLFQTPAGLQRTRESIPGLCNGVPRIVLLK